MTPSLRGHNFGVHSVKLMYSLKLEKILFSTPKHTSTYISDKLTIQ